jgi:hypothetical protein
MLMTRFRGIEGFAGLFMCILLVVGFVQAGWRGVLTALVASWNAWPAIAREEPRGAPTPAPSLIDRARRLGGVTGAILACAGLYHGGWRMGWAWGTAGYALGMVVALRVAALVGALREPVEK